MKYNLSFLFLLIFYVCQAQENNDQLFQIFEKGKIGFMNSKGDIVIKPIFLSVGEFSESLANARINGTYGYIDKTGYFVIKPEYDYATPFSEGLAVVFKDGQPFYINKQGIKPFEVSYGAISQFENNRAKVKTATEKMGFIDNKGKLIIDTVFKNINPFIKGMAVVEGLNHAPYADKDGVYPKLEMGVIDTSGKFIITYGKYEEINNFENDYFNVKIPAESWDTIDGSTAMDGFVDKNGELILAKDHKNNSWIEGDFHNGLAKINLYKFWMPDEDETTFSTDKSYEGYINIKGEIVINDTLFKYCHDFSDNRAFVRNEYNEYSIIDTKGHKISNNEFTSIVGEEFKNGSAFVEKDGKYGLIDTNGYFLIEPKFEGVDDIGFIDDYFFFYESINEDNHYYDRLYGIAGKDGVILINPMIQDFDRNGYKNGLLSCIINKRKTYIDKLGKIIWQDSENNFEKLSNLNLDFMNRGYFYAYPKPSKEEKQAHNSSINFPRQIKKENKFSPNSLSISVKDNLKDTIFGRFNAITVFVSNNSNDSINFNAQDGRLYMKVQALNKRGQWKDIEYLPSSWCGNSYHTMTLDPKHFWTFLSPVYEGDFKTKLRIELKYLDPNDRADFLRDQKEITIYSNEFEGSINPGQLWRKENYYPMSLMDPYFD